MDILSLLERAVAARASDLHITVNVPPIIRVDGQLIKMGETTLSAEDTASLARQMLTAEQIKQLEQTGELDLSFSNSGLGRFRMNIYKQRGSYCMAIRVVNIRIPSLEELGLPASVKELTKKTRGLILVTGPTGSGKSTTLASMIDLINHERSAHVLTLEDPIEYLHKHNKCIINQREVGDDTQSFSKGLRAALRQDPDVILVGEMRDLETMSIAITAAETGHLVLSTLHTLGAAKTIDRIIDVFPPYQQQQIRIQLAAVLEGIISQQLLPKEEGKGRIAAFEIMLATNAIRNLIREGKTHQVQTSIQTGLKFGMQTMDHSLTELYKRGIISRENALTYSLDHDMMKKTIGF
ncbi:type IV pilus twitching motility protein PilT [Geosporobacter ferrireducens]|uniref:Type IV pili twitching motility protein PilT n=1 Tax=Geosporobacter ferrireducens TaxID=1424294 RepID=A0A1D8GB98_9FIRM|nr:type IV pilus twitching motility protein PilT [Geosporobacter ferrireducens]AOT68184.1 type IV pili twitching motility protein PilT [Geosporobacter ferrireducens]MTI54234.1 type IV pilus twitching motility protein PilT [Geosporobacter ferrireducens]